MSPIGIPSHGFDAPVLHDYLRRTIPGLEGAMHIEPISGGQSTRRFFVTYDNRCLVMRKQPPGCTFHRAFGLFRWSVIFAGIAARAKAGNASSDNAGANGRLAAVFAKHAADLI